MCNWKEKRGAVLIRHEGLLHRRQVSRAAIEGIIRSLDKELGLKDASMPPSNRVRTLHEATF